MYAVQSMPARKRGRDQDEDDYCEGFGEHRAKRTASLAIRQSPEMRRHQPYYVSQQPPRTSNVSDLTPTGSDSEDAPKPYEPRSFFSPYSSSPSPQLPRGSQPSPCPGSSQMRDAPAYSDDMEMEDSLGSLELIHPDTPTTTISGRIPTPIHARFSQARISAFEQSMSYSQESQDRRLPSPISEDEKSSSQSTDGSSSMQLDGDSQEEKVILKRGHTRSKHSLRNWTGMNIEIGSTKKFSMGYRSDCEKCRMRVPGHFSHIVTYTNEFS